MSEDGKKSYYAIIPATVRYDKKVKPNAKLLYGEITALCNERGYCWATNEYFAGLYEVNKHTVSRWVSTLKERGYITVNVTFDDDEKKYKRKIELTEAMSVSIDEKSKGVPKEHALLTKRASPPVPKEQYNNTVNSTMNKSIVRTQEESQSAELTQYLYERIMEVVNPPTFRRKPPNLVRWMADIRKLITVDGVDVEDVKNVIDFTVKHPFWATNVLSGEKLRKQYDRLYLEMKRGGNGSKKKSDMGVHETIDKWRKREESEKV